MSFSAFHHFLPRSPRASAASIIVAEAATEFLGRSVSQLNMVTYRMTMQQMLRANQHLVVCPFQHFYDTVPSREQEMHAEVTIVERCFTID